MEGQGCFPADGQVYFLLAGGNKRTANTQGNDWLFGKYRGCGEENVNWQERQGSRREKEAPSGKQSLVVIRRGGCRLGLMGSGFFVKFVVFTRDPVFPAIVDLFLPYGHYML